MGFRVQGLVLRDEGSGFRFWALGRRAKGLALSGGGGGLRVS